MSVSEMRVYLCRGMGGFAGIDQSSTHNGEPQKFEDVKTGRGLLTAKERTEHAAVEHDSDHRTPDPAAWHAGGMLGGLVSLEFVFTRAIDRSLWLRTERAAVMLIALGPLILNLVFSPLSPKLTFDRADPGSPAQWLQERFFNVFPGSQVVAADSSGQAEQLVIRHGTEMFAAWLVWAGTVMTFLVAGYWSLVFTQWQRAGWHHSNSKWRPWLGLVMIQSPFYVPLAVLVGCAALRINPCEESFLFFARHPVAMMLAMIALILLVQPWSERNIQKLEFEFL